MADSATHQADTQHSTEVGSTATGSTEVGSATPELAIDDRERKILECLQAHPVEWKWKRSRLIHGDFQIVKDGQVVVICERKTWKDLGSAFKDGRIWNLTRLKDWSTSATTVSPDIVLVMILEGRRCGKRKRRGGVSEQVLQRLLDTLLLQLNMHIHYTKSPEDTLSYLGEWMVELNSC